MSQVAQIQNESKSMMSYGILNPTNLNEAMQMAEIMSKASIVPKDFVGNPGNILIAMQWGMELGLAPLQAMQNIAVINGRPSLWGDAMIGLVRGSSVCEYVKETVEGEGENMVAVCRAKRKGQDEEVRTFSVEDAKTAGLWGKQGPWKQYPKRMLQMRARGFGIRDTFADVLKGMECAEEQQDIVQHEKDITPEKTAAAEPKGLPDYSQEAFDKNFGAWKSFIEAGKKSASEIIATVESKGTLTDEMKMKLVELEH
tara:strand:+ start:8893 stop:9660 length:768 start_codon:yes stop_codon:yes gene_type:complete